MPPPAQDIAKATGPQTAVLSGGCFWGVQGVFQHVDGVQAVSGYTGGSQSDAHYVTVSTGATGHAESVQMTFDPRRISYGRILQIFFCVAHDPTEINAQGPDNGTAVPLGDFPPMPEQAQVATAYIAQLDAAHIYHSPIVTRDRTIARVLSGRGLSPGLSGTRTRIIRTSCTTTCRRFRRLKHCFRTITRRGQF